MNYWFFVESFDFAGFSLIVLQKMTSVFRSPHLDTILFVLDIKIRMKSVVLFISILVIFCKSVCVVAFVPNGQPKVLTDIKSKSLLQVRGGSTQLRLVLNPAAASVLAGSIAGAVGVGKNFELIRCHLMTVALDLSTDRLNDNCVYFKRHFKVLRFHLTLLRPNLRFLAKLLHRSKTKISTLLAHPRQQ